MTGLTDGLRKSLLVVPSGLSPNSELLLTDEKANEEGYTWFEKHLTFKRISKTPGTQ